MKVDVLFRHDDQYRKLINIFNIEFPILVPQGYFWEREGGAREGGAREEGRKEEEEGRDKERERGGRGV